MRIASLALLCTTLSAQWLHYPTRGIPRTPDGKPNLTAPAPKTPDGKPDLSGIWMRRGNYLYDLPKNKYIMGHGLSIVVLGIYSHFKSALARPDCFLHIA